VTLFLATWCYPQPEAATGDPQILVGGPLWTTALPWAEAYQPSSPCQAVEVMSAQETRLYKIRLAFPGAIFFSQKSPSIA